MLGLTDFSSSPQRQKRKLWLIRRFKEIQDFFTAPTFFERAFF